MPHYYFDLHDGTKLIADRDGRKIDDLDRAGQDAVRFLFETAVDEATKKLADRLHTVHLRDETGAAVLTATVRFECRFAAQRVN